jgi:hypothetical protein
MNQQEHIKTILREEVDKKKSILIKLINSGGLLVASKFVGGYDNLRNILSGVEYLNRDVMINTIKDYFNQPHRLQFLDLNNDLGLEHITLEKGNNHLITLSSLFKRGFTVQIYEKNDDGEWEEIDDSVISFEDDESRKVPILKTIHLYELIDGIMERWSNEQGYVNESELNEKWSEKYKKSINCNNPKGFSQKAHCAGRKKEMKEEELTEKCWRGYTQKGMKTMFGKRYPNCVKKTKK